MWFYIYLTISVLHPYLASTTVGRYADTIVKQAELSRTDPYLFVAIIEHESEFNAQAISSDTYDLGLMQVRYKYYSGKREWLFNGDTNIRAGAYVIRRSMDICSKYLKREPSVGEWLSVYQGSIPSCKATRLTKQVEKYANCLQSDISKAKECKFN